MPPLMRKSMSGTAAGRLIIVVQGKDSPPEPREFNWRPLAQRSAAELRERAREYRCMAATTPAANTQEALLGLARRLDALADEKDAAGA